MTDDISWRARSVNCPYCDARVGDDCVTSSGKTFTRVGVPGLHFHAARVAKATEPIRTKTGKVLTDADIQALADEAERGYDISHLMKGPKLPKRLKHRVRARHYVWCDTHGAVHPGTVDYYEEGNVFCSPDCWRRVYIESDDRKETF